MSARVQVGPMSAIAPNALIAASKREVEGRRATGKPSAETAPLPDTMRGHATRQRDLHHGPASDAQAGDIV
jgi:hypothetical protein